MAKQSKTLLLMAFKLGLSEEDKVLSKAAEFERLLQMKSTVNNIPDLAKTVICLDLAASFLRADVDLKTAIKCSGLKGPTYNNSRKIIENLLELNDGMLTVSQICLTLQCNVAELAEKILQEFRSSSKMELDLSLPQYVCMAVYQACRINKIKVSKSKLLDKSQLKPGQWSKLEAQWTKYTDEKFATTVKRKTGRPMKNAVVVDEKMEVDNESVNTKEDPTEEPQTESYEDWKRRILEAAYQELGKQDNKQEENTTKQADNVNKQVEIYNKQKENANKHNESLEKKAVTQNKRTENDKKLTKQSVKPKTHNETLLNEAVTQNKHTEKENKLTKESVKPNKHNENLRKEEVTQNKHTENENKLTKEAVKPNKHNESLHKEAVTQNKHTENENKLTKGSIKPIVLTFSPRRSPRKTPQKYEPYTSPVKHKSVRLLFPL